MPLPLDWRFALGGQFDSDSHGIADFGLRGRSWSAELLTDTLDLRWTPSGERGRAWVALRAEAAAAGLFITPWTEGAPDPSRALTASYAGLESGVLRYGPGGLYAGVSAGARVWVFGAREETAIAVPDPSLQVEGDLQAGWWTPTARAWLAGGVVSTEGGVSPRVRGELHYVPDLGLSPFLELRAGVAEGSDDKSRTRLGGMTDYVVPVAGAAWAEWWVEDYAALRVGPRLQGEIGKLSAALSLHGDAAAFDGEGAVGLGARAEGRLGRAFLEVEGGYAPWIARQEGVSRASVYGRLGMDWRR